MALPLSFLAFEMRANDMNFWASGPLGIAIPVSNGCHGEHWITAPCPAQRTSNCGLCSILYVAYLFSVSRKWLMDPVYQDYWYSFLTSFYVLICSKVGETERDRSPIYCFTPYMPSLAGTGLGPRQELETQSGASLWLSGSQSLEATPDIFQSAHQQGSWNGDWSQDSNPNPDTLIWNSGCRKLCLNCGAKFLPLLVWLMS